MSRNPYYLITEEQEAIRELIKDFAEKELAPVVKACDEEGRFPREVYAKLCELGINGIFVPEEYGGLGLDVQTICIIREELRKVDQVF